MKPHRIVTLGFVLVVFCMATYLPAPALSGHPNVRPAMIINTHTLAELIDHDDIRIVDVRSRTVYREGHIPHAVNLPNSSILDPSSRIVGYRIGDERLAAKFGRVGIGAHAHVILYDAHGGHLAARLAWALQYFGHTRVSVLDGGFQEWTREGRPFSEESHKYPAEQFPIDIDARRLAGAGWISDHVNDSGTVVIDVRPSYAFNDGHVPGAINIHWKDSLNSDMTWRSKEELLSLFETAGVTKDKNIAVYCDFGNMNGHTYLTLKSLGYPRVRSYERAWAEWGNRPDLPQERGTR